MRVDWRESNTWLQTQFAVRDPVRLILGIIAYTIAFTVLFLTGKQLLDLPVRYVRIDGLLQNMDPSMVKAMAAEAVGQPFVTMDLDEVAAAVGGIPWVADVRVTRRWPDTLVVHVTEHQPMVRWGDLEFLDASATRFFIGSTKGFEHLPRLEGPEGREKEMLQTMHGLNRRLESLQQKVGGMTLSARWSWSLRLTDGTEILCGRQEPVAAVQRWLDWLPALEPSRRERVFSVDLRYPAGFAVIWHPEGIIDRAEPQLTQEGSAL